MQWHSWREDDMEPSETGIWARRSEVEAAIAAKDAAITELRKQSADWYAQYEKQRERAERLQKDAARLDKLPQCFHTLR